MGPISLRSPLAAKSPSQVNVAKIVDPDRVKSSVPPQSAPESSKQPSRVDRSPASMANEIEKKQYKKTKKLGEGTYATVHLGHLTSDPKQLVAIKKIKLNADYRDGLSMDAIREIKYLQELSHPNIIALYSVFASKHKNLNLVLEYLPLGDLEMVIRDVKGVRYGTGDIKAWMGMLGRAVWFCHENFILHRDIKPNNLLIAADGEIKLADFGLARSFSDPYRVMTHQMITRWYRPPELLYGARHYSGAVDIWSVGMVLAELVIRKPFVPGDTDMGQMDLISKAIGSPSEENWAGVTKLPDFVQPDPVTPVRQKDHYLRLFGSLGSEGVDLLMATLRLDPRQRISATAFLQHPWWQVSPRPTEKQNLPRKGVGEVKMGEDLKRRGGELPMQMSSGDGAARKLEFGSRVRV